MRALDQFRRLFAKIAGDSVRARQWSGSDGENRERNDQRTLPSDDPRTTRTTQAAGDDEKHAQRRGVSFPAVWPR
jgi:hypothetical protein